MRPFITLLALLVLAAPAQAAGLLAPRDDTLPPLRVTDHLVNVGIRDGIARTTVTQTFRNDTSRRLEATYVFPLPEQADLTDFQMTFNGKMVQGRVLPAEEARRIYESIVRQSKDPGLIEFIGRRLLQMRVFPIEPRSDTTIQVRYQQICRPVSGMTGYHYPLRTRKTTGQAYGTVRFDIALETTAPLKSVWSPTHAVDVVRDADEHRARIGYEAEGGSLEDDLLLLFDTDDADLGLSLVAHRPEGAPSGHFVLMITPKQLWPSEADEPQDVVFVLDTSGSMAGDKLAQAKASLSYCIDRLDEHDRFSVVRFSTGFDVLHDRPAAVTGESRAEAKAWVKAFSAAGGTNITDALAHVMRVAGARFREDDRPFVVVFLTDGRGNRPAREILSQLSSISTAGASVRIFSFGVGHDVNTKLLDRLSETYTGRTTYVQPGENLELVLGDFFNVVSRPLLTNVQLSLPDLGVMDRFPTTVGDLYHGQQIVIAGRMRRTGHGPVTLTATRGGMPVEFVWPDVRFTHTDGTDYVATVWAGRKIAALIDQIRRHGESDEMIAEVLELSATYGIQTPYSSWLVDPERPELAGRPITLGIRGGAAGAARREAQTTRLAKSGGGSLFGDPGDAPVAADAAAAYGDEHDELDLLLAGQSVTEEAGRAANLIARKNETLRGLQTRDEGRLQARHLARRAIGGRWYNRIGRVIVDESFDEDTELLIVRFASDAYFELVREHPELRSALAANREVVVMANDRTAVLVAERNGVREFSEESRQQIRR